MEMTKVMVIGASGYIGNALLKDLKRTRKHKVIATTTSPDKLEDLQKEADSAYLVRKNDSEAMLKVMQKADALVVCVAPSSGASYQETYLETAKMVCSLLPKTQIKQLVYLSSTSVYGDRQGNWVSEETPLQPHTENSRILCETEDFYLNHSPSSSVTILRLAGIHGPGREHEARVERLNGSTLPGDGEAFSNWVHQEDIVRAIDWVLDHKLTGVYNLCSDDHPTRRELYNALADKLKIPRPSWNPAEKSPHAGNRRVACEKIKSTGFFFLHTCFGKPV